jgi:transporter family-2 protein
MLQQVITILIGLVGGVAVGIQSPVANSITQRVGSAAGSLVIHVSGAVLSALVLVLRGGENIQNIGSIPGWTFGVGAFGLILFFTLNHTIPRIGVATAITLLIVGQLGAGMIVDHLGWLGVTPRAIDGQRLLALGLLLAGGWLMAK